MICQVGPHSRGREGTGDGAEAAPLPQGSRRHAPPPVRRGPSFPPPCPPWRALPGPGSDNAQIPSPEHLQVSTPRMDFPPHPCFPRSYAQTHGVIPASVLPATPPHSAGTIPAQRQPLVPSAHHARPPPESPHPCGLLLTPQPPQPRSGLQQPRRGPSHGWRTALCSRSRPPAPARPPRIHPARTRWAAAVSRGPLWALGIQR